MSYKVFNRGFIILRPGDGLTFFSKDNSANFFGEKEVQWRFLGCLLFENTRKNFKSNVVLVVFLALESKGV